MLKYIELEPQDLSESTSFNLLHVGGCQNCGPILGTLNIRCRIILRTQKGTLFWRTTHVRILVVFSRSEVLASCEASWVPLNWGPFNLGFL